MLPIIEQLLMLVDDLKQRDIPVIVEGKNDKASLRKLGVQNIITLDEPLYHIVEQFTEKEVVILTDFDGAGKRLYQQLNREFSQRGVKVNNKLRHFLMRNTSLAQVEGLAGFVRRRMVT